MPLLEQWKMAMRYTLYDTVVLEPGSTDHRLFSTPVGTMGKDYAETNMLMAGILPNPQTFRVVGVRVGLFNERGAPVVVDMEPSGPWRNLCVQLTVGFRLRYSCPAWRCAEPINLSMNQNDLVAEALLTLQRSHLNIQIREGEPFSVDLRWHEAPRVPHLCAVFLDGILQVAAV